MLLPLNASAASQPRDNDANAMIWGGAYTKTELIDNLEHGDGHGHSAKQLQSEFKAHSVTVAGIRSSRTVNGTVTKEGEVRIGDKVVATSARSYGRQFIPGSTKEGDLYVRPTSVSFQSSQLPAFVHLDAKGVFKYAVIKSCGNIVTASPVAAAKPKAAAPQAAAVVTPVIVVAQAQTQTQTQSQTQTQPAPTPAPQPAPELPQAGAASLIGLAGLSATTTAGWYYRRSRTGLRQSLLAKAGHHQS
jgi:hypothetical protein